MLEGYITVAEAARLAGVSRWAIYTAVREDRLPGVRVLGKLALKREDVEAYRARTAGVGPAGGRPRKPHDPQNDPQSDSAPRRRPGRPRKGESSCKTGATA